MFEKFIFSLFSAAIKNPKTASISICFVVMTVLGYTVKLLFFENKAQQTAVNTNLTESVSKLERTVATLQFKNDSLVNLVGVTRADGLRREIALKDENSSELKAFNKELQKQKADMEQKFNGLQQSATRTRVISEALKQKSNETN